MSSRSTGTTVDLEAPTAVLRLEHGIDDVLEIFREVEATGARVPMTGWTNAVAVMRVRKGIGPVVDLLPSLDDVAHQIDITITDAMKTALGSAVGYFTVDVVDDAGNDVRMASGPVRIKTEVGTT